MQSKSVMLTAMVLAGCLIAAQSFASSNSGSGSSGSGSNSGSGSSGSGKSGNSQTKLEAQLDPVVIAPATTAVAPDAEGEVKYRKQIQKGTTKSERFEASVKIPIPSPALGITDLASAQNADIQILLSSGGSAYAACALDFDEIETELEHGVTKTYAEYKVDVRKELKKSAVRQRQIHGICDIDLSTEQIDAGTPAPVVNDLATAVLVTAPVAPATTPTLTVIVEGAVELD